MTTLAQSTPAPPDLSSCPPTRVSTIIDVKHTFEDAIARYTILEQGVSALLHDLNSLSPDQILTRCAGLATLQQELARCDEQLVAITTLAGEGILHTPFIKRYQHVLATTLLLCDQLWEQTSTIKKNLQNLSSSYRILDSSFQG